MPVGIPVCEVRKWPISVVSAKFHQAAIPKTTRDLSAEIYAPYKLFKPTTIDKICFSGTTRTNYKRGVTVTPPFRPPIPAKRDDGKPPGMSSRVFISGPLKRLSSRERLRYSTAITSMISGRSVCEDFVSGGRQIMGCAGHI